MKDSFSTLFCIYNTESYIKISVPKNKRHTLLKYVKLNFFMWSFIKLWGVLRIMWCFINYGANFMKLCGLLLN